MVASALTHKKKILPEQVLKFYYPTFVISNDII